MIRKKSSQPFFKLMALTIALCSFPHSEEITLSGTVKNSNGKALEGAVVRLYSNDTLSTTTNADGAFTLANVTGVNFPEDLKASYGISIRNNAIVFTNVSKKVSGSISLYSINGKPITTISFVNQGAGQQRLELPVLSSGMYLIAGTINSIPFTRSLVYTGNKHLKSSVAETDRSRSRTLRKKAASAIDAVLIVSKKYYNTTRMVLDSYIKKDIDIVLTTIVNVLKISAEDFSSWEEEEKDGYQEFSNRDELTYIINGEADEYYNRNAIDGFFQKMSNTINESTKYSVECRVMDFGSTEHATNMFNYRTQNITTKEKVGDLDFTLAVIDPDATLTGCVGYAHFGPLYFELWFWGYGSNKNEAIKNAGTFIEVFEDKAKKPY